MDIKKFEQLIDLAKKKGVGTLKYEEDGQKYEVSFSSPNQVVTALPIPQAQSVSMSESVKEAPTQTQSQYKEITSPFVGTFYRAASPDADPYVKVGQKVSKGQVLCIIEAMKIMNEIESDIDGEIVEVCVENETYVEFGQVL